jgi:hypothetical protein
VIVKKTSTSSLFSQNIESIIRIQVILVVIIFLSLVVATIFIIVNPPTLQNIMIISALGVPFITSLLVLIVCFWKGAVQREVLTIRDIHYHLLLSFFLSLQVLLVLALFISSLLTVYTVLLVGLSCYSYNLWLRSFI